MSLVKELQENINQIQVMLKGRDDVLDAWLELQKIWSKLANLDIIESELLANLNKKVLELIQEKESLEEIMNLTNAKPTYHYGEVCSNLKLLQGLTK